MSRCSSIDGSDELWEATNADLVALQEIVSAHFRVESQNRVLIGGGAYARVFLFTLQDGRKVVGRVVFPVRETIKTEAEAAAMELIRGAVPLSQYQIILPS